MKKSELIILGGVLIIAICMVPIVMLIAKVSETPEVAQIEQGEDEVTIEQPVAKTQKRAGNTGIRRDVLLAVMNANVHIETKYHHHFEEQPNSPFEDVTSYRDSESPIILMTVGPPDDLELVQLTIRQDDMWADPTDGSMNAHHAAAFGRCVQRVAMAIDPSWTQKIYEWMAESLLRAFLGESTVTHHNHLTIVLDSRELPNGVWTLSFVVGMEDEVFFEGDK